MVVLVVFRKCCSKYTLPDCTSFAQSVMLCRGGLARTHEVEPTESKRATEIVRPIQDVLSKIVNNSLVQQCKRNMRELIGGSIIGYADLFSY